MDGFMVNCCLPRVCQWSVGLSVLICLPRLLQRRSGTGGTHLKVDLSTATGSVHRSGFQIAGPWTSRTEWRFFNLNLGAYKMVVVVVVGRIGLQHNYLRMFKLRTFLHSVLHINKFLPFTRLRSHFFTAPFISFN